MPELLYEQEGGKMEPSSKESGGGGGPKITDTTIDMKIQLVADASLPSYLIPNLTCDDDSTISASKVKVTLKGDSLRAEKTLTDFKCEITSNFLTDKEKSAITIETYYVNSSNKLLGTNKIYFDESLLSYYDRAGSLTKSNNPFLATATTPDNGASYTFDFNFDKIITAIKELPSYGQIQNMFIFVNNIPGTDDVTKKTLINIFADGFLNLKFSGVPFSSTRTPTSKLTLKIETTQGAVDASCDLTKLFGSDILTGHLHKVLELSDYTEFDFSGMAKPPVSQPVTPPVVDDAAAKAAAKAEEARVLAEAAAEKQKEAEEAALAAKELETKTAADALAAAEEQKKTEKAALAAAAEQTRTAEAAAAANTKATEVKTAAKTAIDGIKSKMDAVSDPNTIPAVVKTFIDASHALATAKAGSDAELTAKAEADLKSASADSDLQKEIEKGLASDSTLHEDVKALLTGAKTIQEEHAKMDTADADAAAKTAAAAAAAADKAAKDAMAEKAKLDAEAKKLEAEKAKTDAEAKKLEAVKAAKDAKAKADIAAKLKVEAEAATGTAKAVNVVPITTTPAASEPSYTELQKILKDSINAQQKKLDDVIAQLQALQLSQANAGSNAAGLPPIIVSNPGESGACGKGDISMESRDGSLIFKVPYEKVIGEIGINTRSAMARKVLAMNAAGKFSDAVDVAAKPSGPPGAGVAATLDSSVKAALQTAKDALVAERTKLTNAKITIEPDKVAALDTAIKTADAAVTALTSAADAEVKAAETPPATKVTGLSAVKQNEFDHAKASLNAEKAKLETAKKELDAMTTAPTNLVELTGLHKKATESIALADTALGEADKLVNAIKSVGDDAEKIENALKAAETGVYKAVALVKTAVGEVKTAVDAIDAAKPLTYQTYKTTYEAYEAKKGEYDAAAKEVSYMSSQAGGATPLEKINTAKETLKAAVQAIQIPVNIDKLSSEDFDKLKDDAAIQAEITKVTEAIDAYTKIIQEITTASATYTSTKASVIAEAKQKLDRLINDNEAVKKHLIDEKEKLIGSGNNKPTSEELKLIPQRIEAFELLILESGPTISTAQKEYDEVNTQAGGSKQSKSSSSKSKSKSKNKTKKNHSAPKSSKSKTPKIIMNE